MTAPADPDGTREPLRIGVVGGGFIAQAVHLPLLSELDGWFRLEAIAEPSRRIRDALAARYGIAGVHAGHRELLDAGGLDAVVVCAPNALHEQVVLDALDAGLHVLVEKPLCLSAAGADRIAARATASRRVVQVGYMKRFAPAYEALLEDLRRASTEVVHVASLTCDPRLAAQFAPRGLVRGGDVPRDAVAELAATLTHQAAEATGCDDPVRAAAYSEAFAGALVHDVNAVHGMLDALGGARGEPVDAFAGPAGELASGGVALPGGARWTMAWALVEEAGAFSERIELLTHDGLRTLRFPAPYLRAAPVEYTRARAAGATGVRTSGIAAIADPYERQLRHFHACVTDGAACRTPPAQAARDLALLGELFALGLARDALGAPA